MSIRIQKNGLLDTIQDAGRFGFQHLGINPGGAMDIMAMKIANALVGNSLDEAVLEMHFPAAEIVFEETVLFALCGADFGATINDDLVPLYRPIIVQSGAILKFTKNCFGARVYMTIKGGFKADEWLKSFSTNLLANAGGFKGRSLQKNDVLSIQNYFSLSNFTASKPFTCLSWSANISDFYVSRRLRFIPGAEYYDLAESSRKTLVSSDFMITKQSDRMGYRLKSIPLQVDIKKEMISSAVTKGTIQLLPDGQLIILMAEHQTAGGYPRVGHMISTDINSLAQMKPGEKFTLQKTDIESAEKLVLKQQRNLLQLQNACNFHLQAYFNI